MSTDAQRLGLGSLLAFPPNGDESCERILRGAFWIRHEPYPEPAHVGVLIDLFSGATLGGTAGKDA